MLGEIVEYQNFNALLGLNQLSHINKIIKHRNEITQYI